MPINTIVATVSARRGVHAKHRRSTLATTIAGNSVNTEIIPFSSAQDDGQ
jgi:hypothetical protein